jgi:long-chain fatty acid transport protein
LSFKRFLQWGSFYNNNKGETIMTFKKSVVNCSVAGAMLVMAGSAAASGFALIEQSGSGLGNAFAGGAASAEDASTIFYNPAGMSRLSGKQISVSASEIRPSAKFSGTVTGIPLQAAGTGTGGDAGSWALVPNGYFTMEVNPQMRIGLGINAPFGLQTQYDANWMGRFQAIKSKLQTVNLNPSVSYQINDTVSLGAGMNYQRISGELSNATNYSAAAFAAGGAPLLGAIGGAGKEGIGTITGSDSAWGYNLGALFNLNPQTRVGMAYRSRIKYNLNGTIGFSSVPPALAAALAAQPVTLAITMPDSFSFSGFHKLDDKWDVMADATWTGWSVFQQLNVLRANGTVLSTTPENWKNTWRIAFGSNYHYSEHWTARMGVAYDQSPVSDAFRTARIPDANRTWLSVGGQYKPGKDSALDFGYAHLFVSNAPISQNQAGAGNLVGTYANSVDIFSVQYAHSF